MSTDLSAALIIWPSANTPAGREPGGHLKLLEHFRPVWLHGLRCPRHAPRAVALPTNGLAAALALHLTATGRGHLVDPIPHPPEPLLLDARATHRLFKLFSGTAATLLRFDGYCIGDDQLLLAQRSGFEIELVDLSGRARSEGGEDAIPPGP